MSNQGDWATWPNIKRVALSMAYSNGMINRFETEEEWLGHAGLCLSADGVDYVDLQILDTWIATLTDDQIEILADGEHTEMMQLASSCLKPELCNIFEDMFDA